MTVAVNDGFPKYKCQCLSNFYNTDHGVNDIIVMVTWSVDDLCTKVAQTIVEDMEKIV